MGIRRKRMLDNNENYYIQLYNGNSGPMNSNYSLISSFSF